MGIGVGLLLIAVGAVLTWAVTASTTGIDVNTLGVILMAVGFVGLLLTLVFRSTWWGPGYFRTYAAGPAAGRRRRAVRRPRRADSGEIGEEDAVS